MSSVGDKLTSAMLEAEKTREENKLKEKNDVTKFVWKGEKYMANGVLKQDEIKLIDASEEQLNKFYKHCMSMLYNTDKNNPGRRVLLKIINDQINRCNAELLMRYLEKKYLPDEDRVKFERFSYYQSIRAFMENNPEMFPKNERQNILVTSVTGGLPDEFKSVTLNYLESACMFNLGIFIKKHITLNFLTKCGLWLTSSEKKELNEVAKKTGTTRIDIIKEQCGLKPTTNIIINPNGLFNYKEFKAMLGLKSKKYEEMTNDQLKLLRDKVLFKLQEEVDYHIQQWVDRISMLEKVAKVNGYTLNAN